MLTTEQRKADICKIIKTFLIFRPESTSKEIMNFLNEHEFAINKKMDSHRISRLIMNMNTQPNNHWFHVEMIRSPGKPVRWRVVE